MTPRATGRWHARRGRYLRDPDGNGSTAYGIMVLTADGDHITEITGFADPALFPAFGMPARMEG